MARFLGFQEIGRIAEITSLSTQFYLYNEPHMPPEIQSIRTALNGSKRIQVRPLSQNWIAGYSLIRDIYGKPALVMKVETPRNVYKQGVTTIRYYIFAVMGICLMSATVFVPR